MHLPDGFLDARTAAVGWLLATGSIALACRRVRVAIKPRQVPLLGLAAAAIFAAQTLNFPIVAGTSGHLLGGVLVAVMLGPSAAMLVMTSVLIVQCLLFADGGVLALGANVFNMGVVSIAVGYAVYHLVRRFARGTRGMLMAAAFASWCSVVCAAFACSLELAASGAVALRHVLPAMLGVHMLIGVGEAVIVSTVLLAIMRTRPDLVECEIPSRAATGYGSAVAYGVLIVVGIALFAAPFASSLPDGLDRVAHDLGFASKASESSIIRSPIPDYRMPGIYSPVMATGLACATGTLLMFAMSWVLARALVRPMKRSEYCNLGKRSEFPTP